MMLRPSAACARPAVVVAVLAVVAVAVVSCGGRAHPSRPEPAPAPATIDLAPGLHLRDLGNGTFVVTHELPWPANSLLVRMPDGTMVMAGTPYTPEATRQVLDWARVRLGGERFVAIDTGYHVDNLGGNAALLEAGIPVHGSDLTVELLRERGEQTRALMLRMIGDSASPAYAAHAQVPYVPPDHVFAAHDGLLLTFGGEQVRVIYPGPSQAPDKVVVFFPARRLLFGGCMVLAGDRPGNIADADLAAWPGAVRSLEPLAPTIVVPGHGDRLDAGLLRNTLEVLARHAGAAQPR